MTEFITAIYSTQTQLLLDQEWIPREYLPLEFKDNRPHRLALKSKELNLSTPDIEVQGFSDQAGGLIKAPQHRLRLARHISGLLEISSVLGTDPLTQENSMILFEAVAPGNMAQFLTPESRPDVISILTHAFATNNPEIITKNLSRLAYLLTTQQDYNDFSPDQVEKTQQQITKLLKGEKIGPIYFGRGIVTDKMDLLKVSETSYMLNLDQDFTSPPVKSRWVELFGTSTLSLTIIF